MFRVVTIYPLYKNFDPEISILIREKMRILLTHPLLRFTGSLFYRMIPPQDFHKWDGLLVIHIIQKKELCQVLSKTK